MTSVVSTLYAEVCAAGILAAWAILRLPRYRPRSVMGALAFVVAAMLLAQVVPTFIPRLMAVGAGRYLVLLGCVLPVFFFLFLTFGWLLCALVGPFTGSGGGGHREPLASRN